MASYRGEPPCDISGRCEVHEDDEASGAAEAMCIHCGGWRYRDSPRPLNWGTEPKKETEGE
jgi:hypothetical protein